MSSARSLDSLSDKVRWNIFPSMNYARRLASDCLHWQSRDRMVVIGGHGTIHAEYVGEEYDFGKDIWIILPKCNEKHKISPAAWVMEKDRVIVSSTGLCCVAGNKRTKRNLGVLEMLDPRDSSQKWMDYNVPWNEFIGFDTNDQELTRALFMPL